MEEMRRTQEEVKREIAKARVEAERATRERLEAERKAEDERRMLHDAAMKRAEQAVREKIEAEMRAMDERKQQDRRGCEGSRGQSSSEAGAGVNGGGTKEARC